MGKARTTEQFSENSILGQRKDTRDTREILKTNIGVVYEMPQNYLGK